MSERKVTLSDASDAYNFRVGMPMVWDASAPGLLRYASRRERLRMWLVRRWERATRWWRPRTVTSGVDVQAGTITLETERWSWRRWRWERR